MATDLKQAAPGAGTRTAADPQGIAAPAREPAFRRGSAVAQSLALPARKALRRYPLGILGALLLAAIAVAALLAPAIAPHRPTAFLSVGPYQAPGHGSLLGTDQLGRDLFTRMLYASRTSLAIALSATLAGIGFGSLLGLCSGYTGGRVDLCIQRTVEVMDAFPSLVLAILFVAMLGPSAVHVTIAVAIVLVPNANRVVRSVTLGLRHQPFVDAAIAVGAAPVRVMTRHILPGLAGTIALIGASALAATITTEAALSFLGLGPPPPAATIGQMLAGEVRQHVVDDLWLAIMPGLALALLIFSVTMIGDALRDAFDPRRRRQEVSR
jgi:peptide/nickel transport system permease protein